MSLETDSVRDRARGFSTEEMMFHHTRTEHPDPDGFRLHVHERKELFLFLSGDAEYYVEGTRYRLEPYSALLMRAGEAHRPLLHSEAPYERIVFEFSDLLLFSAVDPERRLLSSFSHRPGRQNYYPPDSIPRQFILSFLEQLRGAQESDDGYAREMIVRTYLPLFLLMLLQSPAEQYARPAELAAGATDYINRHLAENWSLGDLATHLFVSKNYLNKKFKEATGVTVWQYVIVKRLQLARKRILEGESIHSVFERSGFNDYATFFKRYRDRFGVSPREDQMHRDSTRR